MRLAGKLLLLFCLPAIILGILNPFFFHSDLRHMNAIIMWYYQFSLIGLLFYPMTAKLLPGLGDKGYAVSRLLALLTLIYFNWIMTTLGVMSFTSPALTMGLLLLLFVTHFFTHKEMDFIDLMGENKRIVWRVELLYLFLFCIFLVFHSFHPEIFWGEKPMDYTFLNYNLRNTKLPLEDPWFAGEKVHYYYFGYYFFAALAKMSGVGGELGYALSIATCAALFGTTLFGLLNYVTKRAQAALWGTLLILFSANFKSFYAVIHDSVSLDFKYFWSVTRVFSKGAFAEYPSWSFFFADLHPHVMNYPFVACYLLFLLYCVDILWKEKFSAKVLGGMICLGALYGSFIAINGWDVIVYTLFSCLYFFFAWPMLRSLRSIIYHFVSHVAGVVLFMPMLLLLSSGKKMKFLLRKEHMNSITQHFLHHGHWWVIIALMVLPVFALHRKGIRWNTLFKSTGFRFTLTAFLIAAVSEFFIIGDRINTTFKFITNAYIWGGISAVISFRFFKFYLTKKTLMPFAMLAIVVMNVVLLGSFFTGRGITQKRFFGDREYGLNGGDYMQIVDHRDYDIISWLNDHVEGTPTILERYSKSFDHKAARISMHTGLPTYLGWEGHVYLRGAPYRQILQRKRDIDFVFTSQDPLLVLEFLKSKNINFIVVGNFERSHYPKSGLEKFALNNSMFDLLVSSGSTALYGVGEYKSYVR